MKDILLAAATVLTLAATAAYADNGRATATNTFSTAAPSAPTHQNRQPGQTYSRPGRGAWLFPPIGKYLDQQARS